MVDELVVRMTRTGTTYRGLVSTRRFTAVGRSWAGRVDLITSGYGAFEIRVLDRYGPAELVAQAVRAAAASYPGGLATPLVVTLGAGLAMDPLPGLS